MDDITPNPQLSKWQEQIKDVSGSSTFCILPWIHLATRPNGDMRICCVANASGAESGDYNVGLVKTEKGVPANFDKDLPSKAFNSSYMKSVRKNMLEGKIPNSCVKCHQEENQGVASKRIWETGTWALHEKLNIKDLINQTEEDGSIPYKLQYLDLRLGNTCNLKCVMCSPHDSSQWVQDHKKIFPLFESKLIQGQFSWDKKLHNNFWHENPKFWEEIYDQIPNIKQLYFAGGEPLMIKEHRIFLDEIIKRGCANKIELRYNTNGILVNDEIIEVWKKFKKVKVGISLDGIEQRGEYIRYPLDWKKVESSLIKLDSTPNNIEVNIACALQILNIKHLPKFIEWKVNSKFKKINFNTNAAGQIVGGGLMSVHLVWIPTWMSLRILPVEDKKEIRDSFSVLKNWLWDNYSQDKEFWEENAYGWKRIESILNWMDAEDHSHLLPDFREYITVLDKQRNTNFKTTFPELSHLL